MSNLWHTHQLPHSKHTIQLVFHLLPPSEAWKHTEIETEWRLWFRNFGVQESTRPFQSIKVLNIYSKAQKPVGAWPLNSTGFGAHRCRQGALTCTASWRKLWANSSTFWRCDPTAAWELWGEQGRGAKRGYPALGITTSGTAQHWSSSALLHPFFTSFTWALVEQMGNTLHPTPESFSVLGGQLQQNATTWKNQEELSPL